MPHNEHKPNDMFKHYGVRLVPSLSGTSTAQVQLRFKHHMADKIEYFAKKIDLGIVKASNIFDKKDNRLTKVLIEFDATPKNWGKYNLLKTEISIHQKEMDIMELQRVRRDIEDNLYLDIAEETIDEWKREDMERQEMEDHLEFEWEMYELGRREGTD